MGLGWRTNVEIDERRPNLGVDDKQSPTDNFRSNTGRPADKGAEESLRRAQEVAGRVLARTDNQGLIPDQEPEHMSSGDAWHAEWEARTRTYQSGGLAASTELQDVQEVEYRRVRLERVIIARLQLEETDEEVSHALSEMAALAETAGAHVCGALVQKRNSPSPATYLGAGKARELKALAEELQADTIVVDGDLSPSQRRELEDIVKAKVLDRTAVILDIFAQHAKSREGKAQVELAQLEYLLPRLRGWGESMSRQAGGRVAGGAGIGSRGPGETKIELDRRRIRRRMGKLRNDIRKMAPARETRRSRRSARRVPSVAIAGYTNAGKSTLLNSLTGAGLLTADALFATLDPTVRKAETLDGRTYTLTDTVGFVRSLPTQLVEAFRSTLEEIGQADLVLHIIDASHPEAEEQVETVRDVLCQVEDYEPQTELLVLNKIDLASKEERATLRARYPNAVEVSAATGLGLDDLKAAIAERLPSPDVTVDLLLPFDSAALVSAAHEEGEVEKEEWTAKGVQLRAQVNKHLGALLSEAAIDDRGAD